MIYVVLKFNTLLRDFLIFSVPKFSNVILFADTKANSLFNIKAWVHYFCH